MTRFFTWANRVTITRIGLLFFLVVLVYNQNMWARLSAAALAILVIVMDWLVILNGKIRIIYKIATGLIHYRYPKCSVV